MGYFGLQFPSMLEVGGMVVPAGDQDFKEFKPMEDVSHSNEYNFHCLLQPLWRH